MVLYIYVINIMKQVRTIDQAYETLEISQNSSLEEIKKAYHKLAKKYHPDKCTDAAKKEEAEIKFKDIKEAYDALVEYHKSHPKTKTQHNKTTDEEFFDDIFQHPSDNNQKKTKEEEDAFNNEFYYKYAKFGNDQQTNENTRDKYIKDFERYIKTNKISIYTIYSKICNKEPIYEQKLGYNADDMITKENVYRSYIQNTPDFMKFKRNYKLVKDLNVYVVLYFDESIKDKKLDFVMDYQYTEICNRCEGWGCKACENTGSVIKTKKLDVSIPKCINKKEIILKDDGHLSPWKKGDMIIQLISKENLMHKHQKVDYYYEVKTTKVKEKHISAQMKESWDSFCHLMQRWWNILMEHKTHTIYISIIAILVIIIIVLLATLI